MNNIYTCMCNLLRWMKKWCLYICTCACVCMCFVCWRLEYGIRCILTVHHCYSVKVIVEKDIIYTQIDAFQHAIYLHKSLWVTYYKNRLTERHLPHRDLTTHILVIELGARPYFSSCGKKVNLDNDDCFQDKPGPVFCLLLGVSSGCARPITGQVTSITWPVIGWA